MEEEVKRTKVLTSGVFDILNSGHIINQHLNTKFYAFTCKKK
jgi:hypothetical protein